MVVLATQRWAGSSPVKSMNRSHCDCQKSPDAPQNRCRCLQTDAHSVREALALRHHHSPGQSVAESGEPDEKKAHDHEKAVQGGEEARVLRLKRGRRTGRVLAGCAPSLLHARRALGTVRWGDMRLQCVSRRRTTVVGRQWATGTALHLGELEGRETVGKKLHVALRLFVYTACHTHTHTCTVPRIKRAWKKGCQTIDSLIFHPDLPPPFGWTGVCGVW